jgi:PPE-repeat protein
MLAATAACDGLAAQLRSTAAAYTAEISELEELWTDSSAASMAAAASPYIAWTTGIATQAEQAATQAAAAAAGAYEAAFAMTVSIPAPVSALMTAH